MARTNVGTHNLIAVFVDMTTVQRVIESLKSADVKGEDISILGREGPNAVSDDGKADDPSTISAAIKGTVAGAAGGGVVGGLGGFLIGLAALAVPGVGPVITAGVWATTALGALAGAQGGAFFGYVSGTELSEKRSEAYDVHLSQGHVLLGVHSDDAEEFERAFATVARSQPLEMDRFERGAQLPI